MAQVKFGNTAFHDGCEKCLAEVIFTVAADCAVLRKCRMPNESTVGCGEDVRNPATSFKKQKGL